jgi:hypothetical protein
VQQQLVVTARFRRDEPDVTAEARYTSSNETLPGGRERPGFCARAGDPERATATDANNLVVITICVRLTNLVEANYIDKLVHQKLKSLQILPSDVCGDTEFLPRALRPDRRAPDRG